MDILNLAKTAHNWNQITRAKYIYRRLLSDAPNHGSALLGSAILAEKIDQPSVALDFLKRIEGSEPVFFEAQLRAGVIQKKLKNYKKAIDHFSMALSMDPKSSTALSNRALAYSKLGLYKPALSDLKKLIQLNPNSADIFYNYAIVLKKCDKNADAIKNYSKAISINPDHYMAYNNRGIAFREEKKFREAIFDFDQSVRINPEFWDGYFNKAMTLWMIREYKLMWPLLEFRWISSGFTSSKRNFTKPLWTGQTNVKNKMLLLHSEQGLGDSIQFSRYIPMIEQFNAQIFLEVEAPLVSIFQNSFSGVRVIQKGSALPNFDYHCPLMSLPLAFKTSEDTIPFHHNYLQVSSKDVCYWHRRLGKPKKKRVGLVWQGNPEHPNDKKRSIPLAKLLPKLTDEFEWISLQYCLSSNEETALVEDSRLVHFGEDLGDFHKTAGLCANLDALVSVDTSVAHLSGAIGIPVFLLLTFLADARWHENSKTTKWYPSFHLFRQDQEREWDSVIKEAINKLHCVLRQAND